eukprot:TRINITY_DN322_c3_g1_i1.p1 TRINITY_DN322_c3_g1~~TRINITY_DN322_c3_g1_i1.p1  ORF type:complete len:562 (-),score=171.98 TRINITY_DN322_c3_g1_i1:61-1533(-)
MILREKAMVVELREELWNDEDVRSLLIVLTRGPDPDAPRKSLYNDGPEIPDEEVRQVALGIIFHLSLSAPNRRSMARDAAVVEAVLMGTTKLAAEQEQSEPLRRRALMALVGIALAGGCAGEFTDERGKNDVCDGLIRGLATEFPPETRADVLGTLWSTALSAEVDLHALWKYTPLREATIECAKVGEPACVRENALALLWTMSNTDRNRTLMWEHEALKDIILKGVPPSWVPEPEEEEEEEEDELAKMLADTESEEEEPPPAAADGVEGEAAGEDEEDEDEGPKVPQPADVRIRALRVLEGMAEEPLLREEMWSYKPLATAVLDATDPDEALEIRSAALAVLLQLAMCYANQLPMFGSGVHEIFAEGKDDVGLPKLQRASCEASEVRVMEGFAWAEWEAAEAAAEAAALAEAEEYAAQAFYANEEAAALAAQEEAAAEAFYEAEAAAELRAREEAEVRAVVEEEEAQAAKAKGKGKRKPAHLRGVRHVA